VYDNVAAWMIAGGLRAELDDPHSGRHRIAIREARRAESASRSSILTRVRSRIWTPSPSSSAAPAADCAC
jgi:hypothetical protein